MKLTGAAWKFPQENISTDQIRRPTYNHLPVAEQAKHCLEALDAGFAAKVQPGDIVVGGKNFGCGSSRPVHASLKALGIGAVVAESFGPLFFRNCISGGVAVAVCPDIIAAVSAGDRIEVDSTNGLVSNLTTGKTLKCEPLPGFLREMMEMGGEKPYLKARIARDKAKARSVSA